RDAGRGAARSFVHGSWADHADRQQTAPLDQREPGEQLGAVELLGLSSQARLARVPRPHDDHGQRRETLRLWARDVGVQLLGEPIRYARGADAVALLDEQLRRLNGGSPHVVVSDHAVSLPRSGRTLRGAQQPTGGPQLRPAQRALWRATSPDARREVLHGLLPPGDPPG